MIELCCYVPGLRKLPLCLNFKVLNRNSNTIQLKTKLAPFLSEKENFIGHLEISVTPKLYLLMIKYMFGSMSISKYFPRYVIIDGEMQ